MTTNGDHAQGVQGARSDPLASRPEDPSDSEVSDRPTARRGTYLPSDDADHSPISGSRRRGSPKLDVRMDAATLTEVRVRAARLGLPSSTWVKHVVRDALDKRRAAQVDAAVGAALLGIEARMQASADARELAAQVRPLAINVNDLDARARSGEPVSLGSDAAELIALLREVRELLGDRVAS